MAASLRHQYVVVRHGFSVPNERKLIVSSLAEGTKEQYGLTAKGKAQAEALGRTLATELPKLRGQTEGPLRVDFVVSPFTRARETADKPAAAPAAAPAPDAPSVTQFL